MMRMGLAALVGLVLALPATAGTWAEALFSELTHDFGSVSRGPALSHSYRITNSTGTPVHIASIRVSCGCVSATALTGDLAPGQSTDLVAQMDSRRFTGPKSVTIYVQFDRPQWEEVRLTIAANGRDDLSITPESLAFGSVAGGSSPSKSATVTFLGSATQLVTVQAESNYVQLAARGVRNTGAEMVYEITATLRPDTPVGKWYTDVWLNTSNPSVPRIRLPLSVDVTPALQLSAPVLAFGVIKPGEKAEKRIIVRGPQPFRITNITGTDDVLSASTSGDAAKPVHVIVVGIKGTSPGDFARTVQIITDLPSDSTASLPITATIAMPHAE